LSLKYQKVPRRNIAGFISGVGNVQGDPPSDTRAEREAGLKVGQIKIPLKNERTGQSA
jgi:hypothetical protein